MEVKMAETGLITVKQLAETIKVSRMTIYKWTISGFIPCYRFGGKKMFNLDEVMEWAKNRGSQGRKRMSAVNQYK